MILGFKPQFRDPILLGTKIHTIRTDSNRRWKVGNKIHFATDVRTRMMRVFMIGECICVQEFTLSFSKPKDYFNVFIKIDGRQLSEQEVKSLAERDGFKDEFELARWFFPNGWEGTPPTYTGKLIHWTDFKY